MTTAADIASLPSSITAGTTAGHVSHSILYKSIFGDLLTLTGAITKNATVKVGASDPPVLARWDIINNLITDVTQDPYQPCVVGDRATVFLGSSSVDARGTIVGYTSEVLPYGVADVHSEAAAYLGVVRNGTTAKPHHARSWLFDAGVHGPIAVQAEMLVGFSSFLNVYHNSSPNYSDACAFAATTGHGIGPSVSGAGHDTADTYPVDVGYWAGGSSYASGTYGTGFRVGFKAGGSAGGWQARAAVSILDKGFEGMHWKDYGLHVHTPQSGGLGVGGYFEQPIWLENAQGIFGRETVGAGRTPRNLAAINAFNQIYFGDALSPAIILATDLIVGQTGAQLGFYGASGSTKQTGVAVTAAGIHAALTALGLIAP